MRDHTLENRGPSGLGNTDNIVFQAITKLGELAKLSEAHQLVVAYGALVDGPLIESNEGQLQAAWAKLLQTYPPQETCKNEDEITSFVFAKLFVDLVKAIEVEGAKVKGLKDFMVGM